MNLRSFCAAATFGWLVAAFAQAACAAPINEKTFGAAVGEVMTAVSKHDFARLDALHAEYQAHATRASDGTWMLKAFPVSFELIFPTYPAGQVEAFFSDWKVREPDSSLRPIAEALAWQERAWTAKGGSCYEQGSSASRKAFNALLDRSAAALREGEVKGRDSPLWHVAALLVAGGQLRPASELDGILRESASKFPAFEPLYAARMTFVLPSWGGDFGALDRFIRASAAETQALEGHALYTGLYLDVAAMQGCVRLFDNSQVSWPDMKNGFDDLLARYPDTANRNLYATFACRARDAETTARLLGELRGEARLGMWSPGVSTESCRAMIRDHDPGTGPERGA